MNQAGFDIIKKWEGIEDGDPTTVNLDPYLCPADVWSIAWGHAIVYNGRHLTLENDPKGDIARSLYPNGLTMQEAEDLLLADVAIREIQVKLLLSAPATDNQFAAMVSLVYNIGEGKFSTSTLRERFNLGDIAGAAAEFPKWRKAKGRILAGLVNRRREERALFLS